MQTPYGQTHVPDWFDKLQIVIQSQQEPAEYQIGADEANTREEWMILSDLHTPFAHSNEISQSTNNWEQDQYNQQQIDEMPTWIKRKKDYVINEQYEVVDINSFSEVQALVYSIVNSHCNDICCEKEPIRLIVIGVAGTGKSYLINAIHNLLQCRCVITATTGKAGFNIEGVTIHSLLKLPIASQGKKDSIGQSLCRLQENLNGVECIIIDEYSKFGQVDFG